MTHTYAAVGKYHVVLHVTDLQTGALMEVETVADAQPLPDLYDPAPPYLTWLPLIVAAALGLLVFVAVRRRRAP